MGFCSLSNNIQVAARSTCPSMTTEFYARPNSSFIDTEQPQEKEISQNESSLELLGSFEQVVLQKLQTK